MAGQLRHEIRQTKPFKCAEEELFLNVQRTAEALMRGVAKILKPAGISTTQYNVLRILRGAGIGGLACREISERLVTRDPDITRLLDRLEESGLVSRSRGRQDRRVIKTEITREGLSILEELDEPVKKLHQHQLGHLGEEPLGLMIRLLESAREKTH